MMPPNIRRLFVRILIHCQPVHPEELWETYKDALSEDLRLYNDHTRAYNLSYPIIGEMLITKVIILQIFHRCLKFIYFCLFICLSRVHCKSTLH